MKHKIRAIILLICVALLLEFLFCLLIVSHIMPNEPVDDFYIDVDRLSGAELRGMMNEDKWSPGQGNAYATMHPDFAWLFDDSFVTYIYD